MAITKVCGIETEYGIHARGGDGNPIAISSTLVNAYAARAERRIDWDFEDESPGNDARGYARDDALPPMIETHLANTVLTNGARFYVDHAHPEYSSPECASPMELLLYDRAGEEVLRRAITAAAELFPDSPPIVVYKNNSDGKGNSYGCHENYLMDRAVPFARVVAGVVPHFVTRIIYTGAGKVGTETPALDTSVTFQVSQRAEFFEEVVGLETTLKRPIVNTRDEPHSEPGRFRRLHVIVGDANMSETATFLKVGTTAIILAMIEDDIAAPRDLSIADPVRAIHRASADPSLSLPLDMADGSRATPLEIQWEYFTMAQKYAREHGLAVVGDEATTDALLDQWESVLTDLETEPSLCAKRLDWVAKLALLRAYMDRHGCDWDDARLLALDLQYHDLRPERSLSARLGLDRLVAEDEVAKAVFTPPRSTRAWFRGQCLARWPSAVVAANWDSLVFDLGDDPLRRVPMMDPLKGTAEHTEELLASCASPAELLDRLSA